MQLTPPTASPVSTAVVEPWDGCAPEAAAWHLRAQPGLVWLDSSLPGGRLGRWSVVACAPRWTLTARGRRVHSEIDRIRRITEEKLQSVLTQDEVARFYAALAKLEAQAKRIFPTRGAWRSLVEGTKASLTAKPGRARRPKAAAAR